MMTDEELTEIRDGYWGRPGSKQEVMIRILFAHIDEQASQITTLKAICIKERTNQIEWIPNRKGELSWDEEAKIEAVNQLAKEYPEIFAEEQK